LEISPYPFPPPIFIGFGGDPPKTHLLILSGNSSSGAELTSGTAGNFAHVEQDCVHLLVRNRKRPSVRAQQGRKSFFKQSTKPGPHHQKKKKARHKNMFLE
jgi:hypothetical protein